MRRRAFAIPALFLVLAVAPVLAQQPETASERVEEESKAVTEGEDGMAIWAWANFIILAAGLTWVFRKNAVPFFAQRSIGIRKGMVEADEARADAERRISSVEAKLANLGADIQKLKEDAMAEARSEHQRVSQETAAEIAKIRHNAEQEIVSAGKAARAELKRYSASLAIAVATDKVRSRMTPTAQDALVRGFARHLDGSVQ